MGFGWSSEEPMRGGLSGVQHTSGVVDMSRGLDVDKGLASRLEALEATSPLDIPTEVFLLKILNHVKSRYGAAVERPWFPCCIIQSPRTVTELIMEIQRITLVSLGTRNRELRQEERASLSAAYLMANYRLGVRLGGPEQENSFTRSIHYVPTAKAIVELVDLLQLNDRRLRPLLLLCHRSFFKHSASCISDPDR